MHTLQEELRSNFKNQEMITGHRVLRLPYLNGCIQESLRLLPPVNGKISSRISPGTVIDGIFVPRGVNILEAFDMYV